VDRGATGNVVLTIAPVLKVEYPHSGAGAIG
jgi:hypothetical protein